MTIRRVVTGLNAQGDSVIASDGEPPNFHEMKTAPGFSRAIIWSTLPATSVPVKGDPTLALTNLHPEPAGTVCLLLTLPPDSVMTALDFDHKAFLEEALKYNSGIFERMEPDHPGMHTTDTIDYHMIVEGELWLELGDGTQTRLGPGDINVQAGTRHAWRNKSDRPAKIFSVLVGVRR